MQKSLRMIHPEQETPQKQPFDRMPGERADYYMLFRRYCEMGRGRSLQALWEQEHPVQSSTESENVQKGETNTSPSKLQSVSKVSGTWRKQAAQWKWKERAQSWDAWQRDERHAILLEYLDHDARYITQAQRINTLDMCMGQLMSVVLENKSSMVAQDKTFRAYLAFFREIRALTREIRREMCDFEGMSRK